MGDGYLSHAGIVFAVVLGGVLLTGGIPVLRMALLSWQEMRELKRLRLARHQAAVANKNVSRGLQTMAMIVPGLGAARSDLSARAMDLLDSQSARLMALRKLGKKASLRRRRARLDLEQQLQEISALDETFEAFQKAVLTAVCDHAGQQVVSPPVAAQRYRAVFTVLEHQLPRALWPMMNQILAQHVRLWVRSDGGTWSLVRSLGFRWGRELLFSRKNLEGAAELRLMVGERVVSEFTVEREPTVTKAS